MVACTGRRKRPCDRCEQSYQLSPFSKDHINIHTKYKIEICDQCGETFTYKKELVGHLIKLLKGDPSPKVQSSLYIGFH